MLDFLIIAGEEGVLKLLFNWLVATWVFFEYCNAA
jgi:hypothetical protein